MTPLVVLHLAYGALTSLVTGALHPRRGREAFVGAFEAEGLLPLEARAREIWPVLGRCLACGACERQDASPRAVLEAARGLDGLGTAAHLVRPLARMDEDALSELERACPAAIPFGLVARRLGPMLDRDTSLG